MWSLFVACVTACMLARCCNCIKAASEHAKPMPFYQPAPPSDGQLEKYYDAEDYCEAKTFNPTCADDEVIVITKAEYGRMSFGRCVQKTFGYLGCHKDVTPELDRDCSGRRTCAVRIPNDDLDASNLDAPEPCPSELKTYLNVSYMCLKVQTKPCRKCVERGHAHVRVEKAYLASNITYQRCGSSSCPWRIELQKGQRVNITLFDFARKRSDTSKCNFRYAVIKERGKDDTPVCAGRGRETHVYTSAGHLVEIHMVSPEVIRNNGQFILYYEAIGCPDFKPPKNAWMKRKNGQAVVGCNATTSTWTLRCVGTTWHGDIASCPQNHTAPNGGKVVSLPLGVLVAIVIGIALVIGVLILTVGVVCLKRQQQHYDTRQHREAATLYFRAPQEVDLLDEAAACEMCTLPVKETCPAGPSGKQQRRHGRDAPSSRQQQQQQLLQQRENLYARRMESRPLPSLPNLAAESEQSPNSRAKVQVHRTNSGRKAGSTRTGAAPGYDGCSDPPAPQYFELDPDELKARARHAARAANAHASSPSRRKGGDDRAQKSPEEENAENVDKEVHHNNSCSEIPLRLMRDLARPLPPQRTEPAPANNYSWP